MKYSHTTRRLRLEMLEDRRVLSSISGVLWNDVDGNGQQHVLEPGLPGRTVYLDPNDHGRLDGGESTTTTDATGGYEFAGLPAGNYTVQQALPAGWQQTSPVETRAEWVDVLAPITDGGPLQLSLDFTFGSDGIVYVISHDTDSIERYDPASGQYLGSFVTSGDGGLEHPRGIAFGPDGNLYVASHVTDQILRYDGNTGDFLDAFVTAGRGGLYRPLVIHFGPAGHLFVSHYFSDEILRYDRDGKFIDKFVSPGLGGLTRPRASTFGPDGALYVSSRSVSFVKEGVSFHNVLRYDGETGEFIDVFAAAPNGRPEGLEFGLDGYLYVGQRGTGSVLRVAGESGAFIDEFIPGGWTASQAAALYISAPTVCCMPRIYTPACIVLSLSKPAGTYRSATSRPAAASTSAASTPAPAQWKT